MWLLSYPQQDQHKSVWSVTRGAYETIFSTRDFKNEDFKILPVQSFCFHLWLRLAFQALESRQDRAALAKNGKHHKEEEEQFDQYAFVETLQQKRRTIPGGKDREEDQN